MHCTLIRGQVHLKKCTKYQNINLVSVDGKKIYDKSSDKLCVGDGGVEVRFPNPENCVSR